MKQFAEEARAHRNGLMNPTVVRERRERVTKYIRDTYGARPGFAELLAAAEPDWVQLVEMAQKIEMPELWEDSSK
jgi:hypothetical protein